MLITEVWKWDGKKLFPWMNVIKGKILPFGIKEILRHYYYRSDPKLGPGIVSIRIIRGIFDSWTPISSLYWYSKIKEAVNQPRYVQV